MTDISTNITDIKASIAAMCKHTGTGNTAPNLIAVSKRQPQEKIDLALKAGQRVFGENKVQEAFEHWGENRKHYDDLELHLIGSLQTNKAKDAVQLFDCIQTLDRIKLARTLAKEIEKQNKPIQLFIQVNTGDEPQKGGCLLSGLETLINESKDLGLNIVGLMCIPPVEDDPSLHFALLKKLAKRYDLPKLSMGMSNDYALAASMGATDIRVGTAIFGAREN
ncbi:YggS family pyridoxal phosphate-dependent enzyme [Kordiimonas sp. SCSIO 12610]|uniref:YggS family pyridoxal phosphate-dependent enzyme n=1 Tax=Kordiimonas sp. SCSIO 12610 TaxID=2829597 RepID=UPI00210E5B1E|nr:YggS family pyridoxal phosphate-dependent enzyme [Kordiimonas sp. SCSIO 12610]UTW55451.1 YggS family pyridoxal phosphate-dependent enzyme [Kordiimonas sp. SCSIO 12610]